MKVTMLLSLLLVLLASCKEHRAEHQQHEGDKEHQQVVRVVTGKDLDAHVGDVIVLQGRARGESKPGPSLEVSADLWLRVDLLEWPSELLDREIVVRGRLEARVFADQEAVAQMLIQTESARDDGPTFRLCDVTIVSP